MTDKEITTVCFVGAGTMGCYNALAAALSGYRVVLYDVAAESLASVHQRQSDMAALFVGAGYCRQEEVPVALERVSTEPDLSVATANADLVSESVFERLDLKRDIHRRLDELCPAHTILTTNSSSLLVSDIEDVVRRGDRFAALHTHFGSPLVDIVPGPRTDPAVVEVLKAYVVSTSGVPLVLQKEHPGYLLNAMLGPVLRAGLALHVGGLASREDIDRTWMRERGAPMGPFGLMDLFGLNLILDTWQYRERDAVQNALKPAVLDLLRPRVEAGDLGVKSGRGFYSYPEPAYQRARFLDADPGLAEVSRALEIALIGNAVCLAVEQVAGTDVIDTAWKVGMTLKDAPFDLLAAMGEPAFRNRLAAEVEAGRFHVQRARSVEAWLDRQRAELFSD